jgi:hypothetical protein
VENITKKQMEEYTMKTPETSIKEIAYWKRRCEAAEEIASHANEARFKNDVLENDYKLWIYLVEQEPEYTKNKIIKENDKMEKKIRKCRHTGFYTMGNDEVYCNDCHQYLGFFDPWKLCGFVKRTKDTIEEKYLNEKTVKVDTKWINANPQQKQSI